MLYILLCRYFQYLYSKVLHFNDYLFTPSINQQKQINNFIVLLDKQIGIESVGNGWVFNYLVFLFKQRSEQKTRFSGKFLPLNFVIGKKAFQIYEKRGENWLYWNDMFSRQYNISFLDLKSLDELKTKDFRNDLRRQYVRDEKPLHLCLWTVQYSNKSKYCLVCSDSRGCKELNKK